MILDDGENRTNTLEFLTISFVHIKSRTSPHMLQNPIQRSIQRCLGVIIVIGRLGFSDSIMDFI